MRRDRTRRPQPALLLRGNTGHRLRKALAAALFLAAAALAVFDSAGQASTGLSTVVATHELTSGTKLRAADVRIVRFPERIRPGAAFGVPTDVTGRVLSGAVGQGEPITEARLVGSRAGRPGTSTVPIRLADPGIARLLEPGTKVDVVTLGEDEPGQVLASDVTVLAVTNMTDSTGSSARAEGGPLVLLSVSTDAGTRLAAAALNQPVTVTLR